jgi:hypothetical protein
VYLVRCTKLAYQHNLNLIRTPVLKSYATINTNFQTALHLKKSLLCTAAVSLCEVSLKSNKGRHRSEHAKEILTAPLYVYTL